MAKLLGIRIQKFRALHDVSLGRVEFKSDAVELPSLVCLIGANGSGKTSVLDAFSFLSDCLQEGVEAACDKPHRGGIENLRTAGTSGPIEFKLYYRQTEKEPPITYELKIDLHGGIPSAVFESLKQRRGNRGRPFPFLEVALGSGEAWAGDNPSEKDKDDKEEVKLEDLRKLAVTTLGNLRQHPRIVGLRQFIEGFYLSYLVPEAMRVLPNQGAQKHLNRTGDNLANVTQYLQRQNPEKFKAILADITARIPGISNIDPQVMPNSQLLLAFSEKGYEKPFYQLSMSDGTLKMFAYLLLLADPEARPFLGIEEPENGLYHKLVSRLADELKEHADRNNSRVFVTTHSQHFVDRLSPEQVWLVEKNPQGHSTFKRAADMPVVVEMNKEGIPLGSLWYSNHLQAFSE
jgi:predicted ATPase